MSTEPNISQNIAVRLRDNKIFLRYSQVGSFLRDLRRSGGRWDSWSGGRRGGQLYDDIPRAVIARNASDEAIQYWYSIFLFCL